MKRISHSLSETESAAQNFLEELEPETSRATIVGLVGDLGSGKTAFTQALAKRLGVKERVTSPTFVIQKIYDLAGVPWRKLIHIDAYRLNRPEELLGIGWGETMCDPGNLVLVEWAERVAAVPPAGTRKLSFRFIDEDTREIIW